MWVLSKLQPVKLPTPPPLPVHSEQIQERMARLVAKYKRRRRTEGIIGALFFASVIAVIVSAFIIFPPERDVFGTAQKITVSVIAGPPILAVFLVIILSIREKKLLDKSNMFDEAIVCILSSSGGSSSGSSPYMVMVPHVDRLLKMRHNCKSAGGYHYAMPCGNRLRVGDVIRVKWNSTKPTVCIVDEINKI